MTDCIKFEKRWKILFGIFADGQSYLLVLTYISNFVCGPSGSTCAGGVRPSFFLEIIFEKGVEKNISIEPFKKAYYEFLIG